MYYLNKLQSPSSNSGLHLEKYRQKPVKILFATNIIRYFLFTFLGIFVNLLPVAWAATPISLTGEERSYLQSIDSIKLCVAPDSLPLDDIKEGRHIGMGAEYMKLFESIIDIPIKLVETSTWVESLNYVKNGQCDIIALAAKTPQREEYLNFTESFVQIPFVVITTQEKFFVSKLRDLAHKKLGMLSGYAYVDLIRNRFPEINLVEVSSRKRALELVNDGEIFGFLSGLHLAGYAIQTGGHTNLKINGQFDELSIIELGIGINKKIPHLLDIFNKAIAAIDAEEKQRINNSWLTVKYQIAENYQRIIQFAVIASIIILFLFYRQFYLRKHNLQLAEREKKISYQANYDFLTGLPNRRLFKTSLERKISKITRKGDEFALLLIDLDEFKEINDTLGHDQGDQLLIEASVRIKECLRNSDMIARLGGDEFVVILNDIQNPNSVEVVAQNILDSLQAPFDLKENAFISASVGITFCPGDSTDMVELLKNADQAMYAAKANGRNNYHYFTQEMQQHAMDRMKLIRDLRIAIEEEQFEVFYQPIIDLGTGKVHKAEALIRWHHPKEGFISPMVFIPALEETRMIIEVGEWVFLQSASQAKLWRKKYQRDFQINVNTSPVQFQTNSTHVWHKMIQNIGLESSAIGIEITESMLMEGHDNITSHLFDLRDSGFQVSLDDFGTGYSSLSYLKKFDIDYLKIDKSFVNNLSENSSDLALCEAIIVMAHKLGLKVIAEGVENKNQQILLTQAGCDYAQGYLYSIPLPAAEFESKVMETPAFL